MPANRRTDLIAFYELLSRLSRKLGGPRVLASFSGRQGWPRRGVYFFMEGGETRFDSGQGPRIVRVGTHALKQGGNTELRHRLRQHRGTGTGNGNHRGSIFRLIVGTAIMKRTRVEFPSWGKGNNAPAEVRAGEVNLEAEVSKVIGAMPFLWLVISDEPGPGSLRGYIERNAIALLSNYGRSPLDPPSPQWLGHDCDRERVRSSGLWNSNYVDEDYDPAFIGTMERLIRDVDDVA